MIKAVFAALLLVSTGASAADLAIGDSIALGTGQALGVRVIAVVGEPSCPNRYRVGIRARTPSGSFDRVVVSAGVNDPPGRCIAAIRARLRARRVVWILPAPVNSARRAVAAVAARWGDRTVSYVAGRDHLHPASYAVLARAVRHAWGE